MEQEINGQTYDLETMNYAALADLRFTCEIIAARLLVNVVQIDQEIHLRSPRDRHVEER